MRGNGGRPAREGVEEGKLDRPDSASIGDHSKGTALSQGQIVGRGTEQQQPLNNITLGICRISGFPQMNLWGHRRSVHNSSFSYREV